MKKLLILLAVALMTACSSEPTYWTRKYATTVVRGHVNGLTEGSPEYMLALWSLEPDKFVDSAGVFHFEVDLYSPRFQEMSICGVWYPMVLCPGDTVDIEVDYPKLMALKDDAEKQYAKAFEVRGLSIQQSPKYRALVDGKLIWADAITPEREAHQQKSLAEFGEWEWHQHLRRLAEIDSLGLDETERRHLQLRMEQKYIDHMCTQARRCGTEPKDPYAGSLLMPTTLLSACYFDASVLPYLQANGLGKSTMGRYLTERKQGEDLMAKIKAQQEVSDEEIEHLAPEMGQAVAAFKTQVEELTRGQRDWKPEGDPATWLEQIVSRHTGRIVYVDFWATWCGACRMGIAAMSTVKEKYEKRGVDFVYITDNSSTLDGFYEMKEKHPGDHFLFTREDFNAMNIPEYSGAIPHYLIYGRDGSLIKAISGWGGLESMILELDKALGQ